MLHEIALFWAVLAGFLLADNLVLIPKGGDFLKFGMSGRLRYEPAARFQMGGRDIVLLNPLDPFDRVAITRRAAGYVTAAQLRTARQVLRNSSMGANLLSWIGSAYMAVLLLLAGASFHAPFAAVLMALAATHIVAWAASASVLVACRRRLPLTGARNWSLIVEALFVPAYTANLGKRVWYRHELNLPAVAVGLRQLRRISDASAQELYRARLIRRLDDVATEFDLFDAESIASVPGEAGSGPRQPLANVPSIGLREQHRTLGTWVLEARKCLTTSVPPPDS